MGLQLEATDESTGRTRSLIRLHKAHKMSIRDSRELTQYGGKRCTLIECRSHAVPWRFWLPVDEWRRERLDNSSE